VLEFLYTVLQVILTIGFLAFAFGLILGVWYLAVLILMDALGA
jgi:hypothetical protein